MLSVVDIQTGDYEFYTMDSGLYHLKVYLFNGMEKPTPCIRGNNLFYLLGIF